MESNDNRLEELLRRMYAEERPEASDVSEDRMSNIIDEEWQKFLLRQANEFERETEHFETKQRSRNWMQIAAMFIGILMLSGIVYAAIHVFSHSFGVDEKALTQEVQEHNPLKNDAAADTLMVDSIPQTRIFENTPLDEMVSEIAHYYNKVADIQSKEAHELRLYYKWEPKDALESVVNDLNHFDRVSLAIEDDKLIVKP